MSTYLYRWICIREHVSEVDPMSARHPQSFHHRIGRQWAARINSLGPIQALRQIRGQIVAAILQALQGTVGSDHLLVPIPVRTTVGQRRQQRRSHD
jgi:hypothetical protein